MSLLDALHRGGWLRNLDHALATSLRRLDRPGDAATPDRVLAAAALASLAVGHGHAAFDPARPALLVDGDIDWPAADAWCADLRASRWVAQGADGAASDAGKPLVLERGLLYLRRYREYEQRLAAGLRRIAATADAAFDAPALLPLFAALFPQACAEAAGDDDAAPGPDLQARAAALALLRPLLLITGGPGTGKTTTIARVLLLLLAQARHAGRAWPRIALAAPTGRAAERMAGSLRGAVAALRTLPGVDAALCDALPQQAQTLHRLLGSIPSSARFRHDARTPLPTEIVVVDEASMVDLPLMCKLVAAVPPGARLILLGDRDQLPSVEAGDVLAAIGDAAGDGDPMPPAVALRLAPLLSAPAGGAQGAIAVPALPATPAPGPLAGHRVQLRRGYRQAQDLQLAPLAVALRDGDAARALSLLRGGGLSGVHFHEGLADPLHGATREALLAPWRALQACHDPRQALRLAAGTRLLTALREGAQGAIALNARIEDALAGTQREAYFHGRLLLVTQNSYRHGLFNGDIGVCLRDARGAVLAWFVDADAGGGDGVRCFHPAALPAHGGAFATTVHKAQGSEFDDVWLLLPAQDARSASRELLYTAVTRARRSVHVCASDAVLRAALARHAQRISGLAARLGARDGG